MPFRAGMLFAAFLAALVLPPGPSRADCVQDAYADSAFDYIVSVFPNWLDTPTAAFWLWECEDADPYCMQTACGTGNIRGVTMVNFGTATGGAAGDVREMTFLYYCNGATARQTMSYVGLWGGLPTWTWAGTLTLPGDPYADCWGWANLYVYTDISPCPVDGATIELGPRFDAASSRGGIADACNCNAPRSVTRADAKTIRYVMKKADRDWAPPGDEIGYTLFYGKPGTTNPTTVIITDTQPVYTHWNGGATTAPDPGWDPDPGPPLRLRWTVPGLVPAGGATGEIGFQLTVDWGNGEAFEPGSGDAAAPEGSFLVNSAHISWTPNTTCAPTAGCCTSNKTSTVVKRFLFWKVGDNDILFQGRIGMPDDEMIYSIFMKNLSDSRTWWNVNVWDTVPAELDPWAVGYGLEDACVGWTMTPTGCISANGGRYVTGGRTVLTWKLDMPPSYTLELRWKARLRSAATGTALNVASILSQGRTGIMGGTGHSITPRNFTHEAPILLRTTYISYVGWAGNNTNFWGCAAGDPSYFLSFYSLNKATTFALYKRWCCSGGGAPCDPACGTFPNVGGVSPKIDTYAGDCVGGPPGDWEVGCKSERAPARFVPTQYRGGTIPDTPFNLLHKISSYGPVMWELSQCLNKGDQDAVTYAGTTSLTFSGFTSYTYLRWTASNLHDSYIFVNTDATTPTTVHLFWWNAATLAWQYVTTQDIYNNSLWGFSPDNFTAGHYRAISSDARLIPYKGYPGTAGATGSNGGSYNDFGTMAPNAEDGNLVNTSAPASFYTLNAGVNESGNGVVIIQNVGAAAATYQISRYTPWDMTLPCPATGLSAGTIGAAGDWTSLGSDYVLPGMANGAANPDNAHIYGGNYDASVFVGHFRLYKIRVTTGTVQVYCGRNITNEYSGGAIVHSSKDGSGAPAQTGREFWIVGEGDAGIQTVNVFCPKSGMAIQGQAGDGTYSATYTTNDSDECVSFRTVQAPGAPARRNYRYNVTAGGAQGDALTQYICLQVGEKFYTAPFLKRGTYYDIIVPPVVYVGQSFWMTVIVMDTGGVTNTAYNAITTFTSTDPNAENQGKGMATYDYTWVPGTDQGVKIFIYVRFYQIGQQTIVAADTLDGSIIGVASVMVVGADVKLQKSPPFTVASSGETIQFRICWSNYSSATANAFTITDAVPMGTSYVPEAASLMFCGAGGPANPTVTVAYAGASATTPGTFNTLTSPTQTAPSSTRWLRWTIQDVYVFSTGCVCFRGRVD